MSTGGSSSGTQKKVDRKSTSPGQSGSDSEAGSQRSRRLAPGAASSGGSGSNAPPGGGNGSGGGGSSGSERSAATGTSQQGQAVPPGHPSLCHQHPNTGVAQPLMPSGTPTHLSQHLHNPNNLPLSNPHQRQIQSDLLNPELSTSTNSFNIAMNNPCNFFVDSV